MRIRVRGPSGNTVLNLSEGATWRDLRDEISRWAGTGDFQIKHGYPPRELDTAEISPDTLLTRLGSVIKLDGEQLLILPSMPAAATAAAAPSVARTAPSHSNTTIDDKSRDPPSIPVPNLDGTLVLRVMPDDNSCLFRALGSAVLGDAFDAEASAAELRSTVAQTIQSEPLKYTRAVLDNKSPDQYCRWIQDPDSWGGGIELAVLSTHFGIEVCSVNVQDGRVDRFNQGQSTRVVLVYSGIHYDVVALEAVGPRRDERRVFDVLQLGDGDEDGGVLDAARELCAVLRRRHYYTDTAGFQICCGTCGWKGKGQRAATAHAAQTGHTAFGEA